MGRSRPENSFFRYPWSHYQENIMNNQLFRQYSSRPQYYLNCKDGNKEFIGDAFGNPANTSWSAEANRFSVGGGPYQWHMVYDRCEKICTEGDDSGILKYFIVQLTTFSSVRTKLWLRPKYSLCICFGQIVLQPKLFLA